MKFVIIALFITLPTTACYGAEATIEKMLFDKEAAASINWQNIPHHPRLKATPTSTQTFANSSVIYEHHGEVNLNGIKLKIAAIKNNGEFQKLYLGSDNTPQTVEVLKTTLIDLYGKDYVLKPYKIKYNDYYLTFYDYQWTVGSTRILFGVMGEANGEIHNEIFNLGSLYYGSLDQIKKVNPVVFITCNYGTVRSDGSFNKIPEDLVLGIDDDIQKVLTIGHFDSTYNIEGTFLVTERKRPEDHVKILIDRTTGRLSGFIQTHTERRAITGTCTKQASTSLF